MPITTTSPRGRAFLRSHEGTVRTCYLDPVKIRTIGVGFTMRSKAVREALARLGITELVPGKTKLTDAQIDAVLSEVLAAEFEPAVVAQSPADRTQHQMDAATSVAYNLGAGAMGWQWAKLWRAGSLKEAAAYLSSHYNTAGGKKLAGLVRRRKEEAELFLNGNYGGIAVAAAEGEPRVARDKKPALQDPVVREAQELLTTAGLNPGAIDGWMGEQTKAAVIAYQKAHPHLVADGVIGPATLAQLRRDATAAREAITKGAGSGVGVAATAWTAGLPWAWIASGAVVIVLAYVAYRNRDVLIRRWNTWRGKEVAV
jgi:GH24 family phage-related lysozyme (muramidase)